MQILCWVTGWVGKTSYAMTTTLYAVMLDFVFYHFERVARYLPQACEPLRGVDIAIQPTE